MAAAWLAKLKPPNAALLAGVAAAPNKPPADAGAAAPNGEGLLLAPNRLAEDAAGAPKAGVVVSAPKAGVLAAAAAAGWLPKLKEAAAAGVLVPKPPPMPPKGLLLAAGVEAPPKLNPDCRGSETTGVVRHPKAGCIAAHAKRDLGPASVAPAPPVPRRGHPP